ncbi:MAG: MFS transporter [Ekhidna sp.]
MNVPAKYTLPIIVIAQFLCTTLWFAGNAVMPDLMQSWGLENSDLGSITSSVQLGFIVGTLSYAFFTISDRYNPSAVFFISALFGSVFNVLIVIDGISFSMLLTFRFFTGFFLAGIYPVGMKIASDYFARGLGKALSLLVGALVLGTAFPHLISGFLSAFSWKSVLYATSTLAVVGGSMIFLFVKPGPYRRPGKKGDFRNIVKAYGNSNFKAASLGYFGHMWELYTFWAFVPLMLLTYGKAQDVDINVPFLAFLIIGMGSLACIIGGFLSIRFGEKKLIVVALAASGLCCLFSPLMFHAPTYLFIGFLIFWGWAVIIDSPLLSALVAFHVDPEIRGSALTITNSIGFIITILSIQLISTVLNYIPLEYVWVILAIGPALGLYALSKEDKNPNEKQIKIDL